MVTFHEDKWAKEKIDSSLAYERFRSSTINSARSRGASWYVQVKWVVFPTQISRTAQTTATPQLPQPVVVLELVCGWSGIAILNLLTLFHLDGYLLFCVTWYIIDKISTAFLLRLSGMGQWYPSSKNMVCSSTEKIAKPQWHLSTICTGRNMVTTLSMSLSRHILSTTLLKTPHPEDRNDGSNRLWHAFLDWFALSQNFCVNKLIISSDRYRSPQRKDKLWDVIR